MCMCLWKWLCTCVIALYLLAKEREREEWHCDVHILGTVEGFVFGVPLTNGQRGVPQQQPRSTKTEGKRQVDQKRRWMYLSEDSQKIWPVYFKKLWVECYRCNFKEDWPYKAKSLGRNCAPLHIMVLTFCSRCSHVFPCPAEQKQQATLESLNFLAC